jgi:general secretion pathway protein I
MRQRGMTLIEILVAFVVLSTTMAVIMQIFSGGIRNARLSEGYSRAVFLAQSRLAAAGVEQRLVPGNSSGQVGSDLRWQVQVAPFDDAGAADKFLLPTRLYEVRVNVTWSDDGKDRQIELSTLRLGPKS